MPRVRKSVLSPNAASDIQWLQKGVAAMKGRLITASNSWRYQAAIHEYIPGQDPLAVPGEHLPSAAEQQQFWTQCQHGSWYFLPWHRMYLYHFEAMIAAAAGAPADWALPYWNYSPSDATRLLPAPFRNRLLPDGTPNALYVAQRAPGCNAGKPFADARDTDLTVCLAEAEFSGPAVGGAAGFGGPNTPFEHSGGTIGALEGVPHGSMHDAVGGDTGWMSAFNTAALDPIFWLHHANIDRLWQVWLNRDPSHTNPNTADWLTSVSFRFHDVNGQTVIMTPSQVLDTSAAPLSYIYDDTGDPLALRSVAVAVTPRAASRPAASAPVPSGVALLNVPPEMVGASTPLQLQGTTHAEFTAQSPRPRAGFGASRRRRVFLSVENIRANARAGAYDVYLNVPAGHDPHQHEDLFVGRIPLFGLAEASRASTSHGGSGLQYALDITNLYAKLAAQPGWNPQKVRVSFVPARASSTASAVSVGRVGLYFE